MTDEEIIDFLRTRAHWTTDEPWTQIADRFEQLTKGDIVMNKIKDYNQELLTIFMEECAEAIVEASKIIRFGNDTDRLESEIGDLYCMLTLMHEADIFSWTNVEYCADAKREKLKKWSNLLDCEQEDVNV